MQKEKMNKINYTLLSDDGLEQNGVWCLYFDQPFYL